MSQSGQWQVAGSAAENYEQYLVPAIFEPWAADLIKVVELRPGERILDVACGTGILARLAADRVGSTGRIVGIDLNPGMIAVAQTGSAALIEWREGNAGDLPFEDGSFDVILCQQGLQFFPDRALALNEMRRVLGPGGRVGIATWREIDRAPGFAALATSVTDQLGAETAAPLRGPFGLANEGQLRALLAEAGFKDVVVRSSVRMISFPSVDAFAVRYLSASPLAGTVAQLDDGSREQLIARVRSALGQHVTQDGLHFPIEAHLSTGRS